MLEDHFSLPRTVDRIRGLWLGQAIELYVGWLAERRAAPVTIRSRVQCLVHFDAFATAAGAASWNDLPALVAPFVEHWVDEHCGALVRPASRASVRARARVSVEEMLQLVVPGFVRPSLRAATTPFLDKAPGFFDYLREERGLRPATLHRYEHNLRVFENYLQQVGVSRLLDITPSLITAFVTKRGRRLSRRGMQGVSDSLRGVLHYAHRQGLIPADLARAVPRGRDYRQASIPRAISWDDVQRMLDGVDRRSAVGRRDYALLLLLVSYGLRAREVAAMRLDDIDWKQSLLHVPIRKGGHSTIYPLSAAVGEAIIEYLRRDRPAVDDRHLFLLTKAPYSPISQGVVPSRVSARLHAAGIKVALAGSHTLRHTCVQRLVEADVPFKTIGDYVGHSSPKSTLVYGKVALHKLRQLTLGEAEDML
ncbi:MAG TPA: tyrosine-type recombinase/integrase [Caulobacteraceae bacterium]|nr:tyrosine-type recombinase/integrase [Caulobacteraceae bacterium]